MEHLIGFQHHLIKDIDWTNIDIMKQRFNQPNRKEINFYFIKIRPKMIKNNPKY